MAKYSREQGNKRLVLGNRGTKLYKLDDEKHFSVYFSDFIYGHLCTTVIGFVYFTQELKQSQGSQLGVITKFELNCGLLYGLALVNEKLYVASHDDNEGIYVVNFQDGTSEKVAIEMGMNAQGP